MMGEGVGEAAEHIASFEIPKAEPSTESKDWLRIR